jgi:hypothetical protein
MPDVPTLVRVPALLIVDGVPAEKIDALFRTSAAPAELFSTAPVWSWMCEFAVSVAGPLFVRVLLATVSVPPPVTESPPFAMTVPLPLICEFPLAVKTPLIVIVTEPLREAPLNVRPFRNAELTPVMLREVTAEMPVSVMLLAAANPLIDC